MKIQEVILKAMAGKLKWWEAAEIIGVTDRTMRRWRERYQEHGYRGLWDRSKRSPSPKRIAVEVLQRRVKQKNIVTQKSFFPCLELEESSPPRCSAKLRKLSQIEIITGYGATRARLPSHGKAVRRP